MWRRDTLAYVERDLTDEGGGFYSAEDADSIPPEEAHAATRTRWRARSTSGATRRLPSCSAAMRTSSASRFGVLPDGNAPFDPQDEFVGKNLLYAARGIDEVMSATAKSREEVEAALARARAALFERALDAPAPASRRQGADRVERADDCRVRTRRTNGVGASFLRTVRRRRTSRSPPGRAVSSGAPLERGHADAAATLSRGRCGCRGLRRRLRLSRLRPARAVPG